MTIAASPLVITCLMHFHPPVINPHSFSFKLYVNSVLSRQGWKSPALALRIGRKALAWRCSEMGLAASSIGFLWES